MTNTRQVKFVCRSCEYINSMELGMPGFEPKQTEFESVTEAFQHLRDTDGPDFTVAHDVIAVISDENT